ncbi:MAG: glycine cleavage system protein GcvH [Coriobacteriia bacterium]|nr:glycine cleavage system protein GcvH [Coriobacteriia bacterium]MCL2537427.1 glycine cleavage system protein GcvH [Coriobacteriia bacterium]
MSSPADRKYSSDHEWILVEGDIVTIGITKYAADQLGSIVYVDLPEVGDNFESEEAFGEVESVKSVSELMAPVGGLITEVNDALDEAPESVNEDPYAAGWLVKLRLDDASELDALLDAAAYDASLA